MHRARLESGQPRSLDRACSLTKGVRDRRLQLGCARRADGERRAEPCNVQGACGIALAQHQLTHAQATGERPQAKR
jgi:hypothetical protein